MPKAYVLTRYGGPETGVETGEGTAGFVVRDAVLGRPVVGACADHAPLPAIEAAA